MPSKNSLDAKVYHADAHRTLSMQDLLDYFTQHGSLRVSDLHLKVNCPPIYRVDGMLQKMKGAPLTPSVVEALV